MGGVPRTGFRRSLDDLYDYLDTEIPLGLLRSNDVKWVYSGGGVDDVNHGDFDTPYATVDYAIGACAAGRGDLVVVKEGHAETVTASSLTLDVAGVTVICLGHGKRMPTFTYGAAAATINVSAANCRWISGHFIGNFDNVAAAFTVAAKDFWLDGGDFLDSSSALHFLSIVVTSAVANECDGLTITRNVWLGLAVAPNAFVSILEDNARVTIADNDVDMAATNDVGHFLTLSSKNITRARIVRNTCMVTGATDASVGIFITGSGSGSTGIIANNYVSSLDTTTELLTTTGMGMFFFENYYTGTADKNGKLWPLVDSA